jgi:hypothetical protein
MLINFKFQVPDNVKLQKDTVLSLVKGATVFINYLGACVFHGMPSHIHIDPFLLI